MKYTDAQIKAINQGRNPAIVSAGAGSGKTAVLTQRVVRLICDKNENIDPSKIVVVTFTVKAADELKARLDALMIFGYRRNGGWRTEKRCAVGCA